MTIAETLLLDFDPEVANTRRLLDRIPEDNPKWKPHGKSMPIGRLAQHVAQLPGFGTRILTTDHLDMGAEKFPEIVFQSRAHLISTFEKAAAELKGHLAGASDEHLQAHWKLSFGDKVFMNAPRMQLYRTVFQNHLVHHRGQLTVYLRLLNIAVPGLYGPSSDEPFGP